MSGHLLVAAVMCLGLVDTSAPAVAPMGSDGRSPASAPSVIVRPDGSWHLEAPAGVAHTQSAQWDASVCAGKFFVPTKIANNLEWGAEQWCEGDYAPQSIRMRLQSTCIDWYCQLFTDETGYLRTPYSEDLTPVSRLHFNPQCVTGTFRKYRITAFAYVRGVEFGPFVSNESVQACDISP